MGKPLSEHTHKNGVQARADDFNERITTFHRQPERSHEKQNEKGLVLPAVQFPLMFPKPNGMAEQRLGIADRPQVADGRSVRTNQITKKMQMKCEQAQK